VDPESAQTIAYLVRVAVVDRLEQPACHGYLTAWVDADLLSCTPETLDHLLGTLHVTFRRQAPVQVSTGAVAAPVGGRAGGSRRRAAPLRRSAPGRWMRPLPGMEQHGHHSRRP
jgi:hypothetical protein